MAEDDEGGSQLLRCTHVLQEEAQDESETKLKMDAGFFEISHRIEQMRNEGDISQGVAGIFFLKTR